MADSKPMTLDDVSWPKLVLRSGDDTKNQLAFRVWGGTARLALIKDGEFKAFFEKPLDLRKQTLIKMELRKMLKAGPETKFPLVFAKWNPEEKRTSPEWVFAGVKDSKLCYSIEIHWNVNIYKFPLKGPFGISRGSDSLSDADKSEIELLTLIDFLDKQLPIATTLSNRKREFNGSGSHSGDSSGSSKGSEESYF